MNQLSVAAVQMVSGGDIEKNFKQVEILLARARDEGAEVALLPETYLAYGIKHKPNIAAQKAFLREMGQLASSLGIWVVAGTYPLNAVVLNDWSRTQGHPDEKPYAGCAVFDNEGHYRGGYAKIHLFDVVVNDETRNYQESQDYLHGEQVKVFDSPWCKFGIAVCYDLRFPELFIKQVAHGCKVIFIPSAFTEATGRAHWEILLRARAIETQCFIVAANQGGVHDNGRVTWGESMIVNPWGDVVSKLGKGEGVLVESLSLDVVDEIRMHMPIQRHRRLV